MTSPSPGSIQGLPLKRWVEKQTAASLLLGSQPSETSRNRGNALVLEILADVAWSGNAFRHAFRYVRVRPELHPDEVSSPFGTP